MLSPRQSRILARGFNGVFQTSPAVFDRGARVKGSDLASPSSPKSTPRWSGALFSVILCRFRVARVKFCAKWLCDTLM